MIKLLITLVLAVLGVRIIGTVDASRLSAAPPDPDPQGLWILAQQAEIIVDADIVGHDGAAGRNLTYMMARQWYKRPAAMTDDFFTITRYKGSSSDTGIGIALQSDHRIIFAVTDVAVRETTLLAIYGISNGYVDSEEVSLQVGKIRPHSYLNWPTDRFLAAVRAVTQVPRAADLPPSGHSNALPSGWLLLALTGLLVGLALRCVHR